MSDGSDISPDAANNHSQTEAVQTCNENGLGEDEQRIEVTKTKPFPPVGSFTTPSSVVDVTDNESELLEVMVPRLDSCAGVVKVEFGSNIAEDDELVNSDSRNDQSSRSQEISSVVPPFYEQMDTSNSVACQTDWSWLAAYRAIKDKLPQPSTSTILKSKSGSKISKLSEADIPGTTEAPASSLFEDLDHSTRMLESLKSDPWPDRADEYGIPIYHSSEEEEFVKQDDVAKEDKHETESKPEEDEDDSDEDDDEDDDEDEEETEETLEQLLTGICRFCGQEKKPFPSLEDQENKSPEDLYCCSEFREYITKIVTKTGQPKSKEVKQGRRSKKTEQGQRSIDSSSASGNEDSMPEGKAWRKRIKANRRVSQNSRVSIRLKDKGKKSKEEKKKSRRDSKHQEERRTSRLGGMDDGVDKPCIVYGREMTTINYQLSSRQCMNWTLGLDSGATSQRNLETGHVVEPVQPQGQWAHLDSSTGLLCQTYDNGTPFLVVFSDGSGNVFYPSGQIAVSIITSKDGEYLYIIQDTNSRLLGIYEPNGKTVTYYQNGSMRVCTDETGGLEMDTEGNRRKQWKWNEQGRHVHAPPLYNITCSISSSFTFSISSQQEMTLLFDRNHRACRFSVGSSPHGLLTKKHPLKSDMLNESELYIKNMKSRIGAILQKTSTLLKLPGSPRLEGSLTPVALQKRRGTPSSTTQRRGSHMLPAINH